MIGPRWCIAALAICAALPAACGPGDDSLGASGSGPTVVATTTQLGDLARQVAGTRAAVRQILEPNTDPHDYEPRPSDVRSLTDAKVVLRSGGDLDAWLSDVLDNAGSHAATLTLSDAVRTRRGDPHWWQDPRNAVIAVEKIRDALAGAEPAARTDYTANANAYLARLRAMDRAISACFERIPRPERKLVTDHDALGYYAARYAIRIVGVAIPGLSTQAQASAGEVARLVRTIRAQRVTTIFTQGSANSRLARAIARDAGAELGPALYADTLGPAGSPGATYIGSLRFNTRALAAGFGATGAACQL